MALKLLFYDEISIFESSSLTFMVNTNTVKEIKCFSWALSNSLEVLLVSVHSVSNVSRLQRVSFQSLLCQLLGNYNDLIN